MMSVVMLNVIMPIVTNDNFMQSVIMLSVTMLNAVMLNVVAPAEESVKFAIHSMLLCKTI
jgi:hypothetical protein